MKTTTKILAGLLVIAMMTVLFASCGGGQSIVGKWEASVMTYEFKGDGTYTVSVAGVTSTEGTYKVEGGKLYFDNLGGIDYTVKGDSLSFSVAGYGALTFTKAK